MMTRKHFVMLAETVRDYLPAGPDRDAYIVALCGRLREENPNFGFDRFKEACGFGKRDD